MVDTSKGGSSEGTPSQAVPHGVQQDGGSMARRVLLFLRAFWASCTL